MGIIKKLGNNVLKGNKTMSFRTLALTAALTAGMALAGCANSGDPYASTGPQMNKQTGGAVLGAVLGGLVGGSVGGEVGSRIGERIDAVYLRQSHCIDCGHDFEH